MVVKFNHLLPAMPELGMGLPNTYVPEPVSLCFHVTYAETQTNNLGVSLDAVP